MEAIEYFVDRVLADLHSQSFSADALADARDLVCNVDDEGNPRWLDEKVIEIRQLIERRYEAVRGE
jgi:hypothetical protein